MVFQCLPSDQQQVTIILLHAVMEMMADITFRLADNGLGFLKIFFEGFVGSWPDVNGGYFKDHIFSFMGYQNYFVLV